MGFAVEPHGTQRKRQSIEIVSIKDWDGRSSAAQRNDATSDVWAMNKFADGR